MRKLRMTLSAYSALHFAVDFACAALMASMSACSELSVCLLIYNFCAFAMQLPIGIIADKLNRNAIVALTGCALVALGFAFYSVPVAASLISGLGNACFHIGGGIDTLNMSDNKARFLGIFVSPGALGIFLGALLVKNGISAFIPLAVLVAVAAAAAVMIIKAGLTHSENAIPSLEGIDGKSAVKIILLFSVVCLRSYSGMLMSFEWKSNELLSVAAVCALALGKACGGFLSDRLGARLSSGITLSVAALLFIFSDNAVLGIAAIFLFNMTMPVTLFEVSRIMNRAKGFSFGLLTLGLFLGYLPVWLGAELPFDEKYILCAAALLSAALLALCCGKKK